MVRQTGMTFYLILLLVNLAIIAAAYIIEYQLGVTPCNLCYYERYPYFAAIIILLLCLFLKPLHKYGYALLALTYCIGVGLSTYHILLEVGIIAESSVCTHPPLSELTFEEYEKLLTRPAAQSCSEPDFFIFGLSLANWNVILSAILMGICLFALTKFTKDHHHE